MFTLRFYNLFFNILFTIMALLLLIDELLPVDIDSQVVKRLMYIGLLVFTPAIILWNLIFVKGKQKWFSLILPAIIGGLFLRYGVLAVLFSTGTWSTQNILL